MNKQIWWILGTLVLIAIVGGIYFWFSGDSSSVIEIIPAPPSLPS